MTYALMRGIAQGRAAGAASARGVTVGIRVPLSRRWGGPVLLKTSMRVMGLEGHGRRPSLLRLRPSEIPN